MPISFETALPVPNVSILDLMEYPQYATTYAASILLVRRGAVETGAVTLPLPLLPLQVGAGPTMAIVDGANQGTFVSAVDGQRVIYSDQHTWPVGVPLVGVPAVARNPARYRLGYVIRRSTAPLVASVPVSLGFTYGGPPGCLSGSTLPGYEIVSLAALNSGRWTVRIRRVGGGALVDVQDTGVAAGGINAIEIGYDHTTNPRCFCRVNGNEVGVVQGLANIPAPAAFFPFNLFLGQGQGLGTLAGQTDAFRQGRLRITELPGFDTA